MCKYLEIADAMTEAEGDDHIMLDDGTLCEEPQEPELIPLEAVRYGRLWISR